ncbi:recombinase RecA [Corynebacterium sp. TA-R-1]|uniref:Protein RecA n=1 Tax=Corynebacterium stercoris TaxID=2943490 RepID=A0ABT1G3T6_9CORY|nr:recombinase RecA [Corynebacterium stercoris]MCP1388646.1 recombinase RecA [Corynebacterium stercoris]
MATKKKAAAGSGNDRQNALDAALAMIEKDFGKGAIMRLGDENRPPIQSISSGNTAIDVALGIGGWPRGRVVEIYGPESSGKTTVALHAIAQAQRAGGIAAFIDAEHALDPEYAKKLGVDTDNLLVSQPDTGEQALEIADMLVRSGAIDMIVIDSVAALTPKAEIEGEMGDSHVGLQARLMSQALRKMTGALYNSGTTAIFINQLREKIGVMFGSPETTTGGKALKFYASVRCDVRRIQTLKDGQDSIGNRTRLKVVKNKVSPPFKIAEFDIMYGEGISRESSIIDMGVDNGIVKKSGSWFTYEGEQLGQGKEKARMFLKDNPELADEIEDKIFRALGVGAYANQDQAADDALSDDPVDMVPNIDFDDDDDELLGGGQ